MQDHYGIDIEEVLDSRSARWLRIRLTGLIGAETRLHYALFPAPKGGER